MTQPLTDLGWPADRLGEALDALARQSGLGRSGAAAPAPVAPGGAAAEEQLGLWIEAAARWLGCEAEAVQTPYGEVEDLVAAAAPALVRLPGPGTPVFLALFAGKHGRVSILTPERRMVRRPAAEVRDALCREVERPRAGEVEQLLADAGLRGRRRPRVRRVLFRQLLVNTRMGGCWLLRPAGAAGLGSQARETRLPRLLFILLCAHAAGYGLWVLSWWLLGSLSLHGRLAPSWLAAWMLLLATLIPCRLAATAAGGLLSIHGGSVLKRRLLVGALKMEPDEVRHLGVGQLLGRVIESEVLETMALTGGFLGLTAVLELGLAAVVLGAGAGSGLHVALLGGTVLATGLLALGYFRRRRCWTEERVDLTNDLVERMVGHRTRWPSGRGHWNEGEDQALERYFRASASLDRLGVALQVLVPRLVSRRTAWPGTDLCRRRFRLSTGRHGGWHRAGLSGIARPGGRPGPADRGMDRLGAHRSFVAGGPASRTDRPAPLRWRLRAGGAPRPPFRAAAARRPRPGLPLPRPRRSDSPGGFSAGPRRGPALARGAVRGRQINTCGILAGGRVPEAGLLLCNGLDRETLGAEDWRRRVVLAPQYHENHVLMGTFAFNVLLGRGWPPRPNDLEEAERVCRALDLGPLLDRMPAGMQQVVGETGWQLSHGEKSRLYIARAILQGGEVLVLDESFAALDPPTLRRTLAYVLEKAPTLLVIAHP